MLSAQVRKLGVSLAQTKRPEQEMRFLLGAPSRRLLGSELRPSVGLQETARRAPVGADRDDLFAGTFVFFQKDFSGASSTQELTLPWAPSNSKINPCTIAPLHLGHRVGSASCSNLQ